MKKMWVCGLAAAMTVVMTVPAFAGEWKQDLSRPASQDGTSGWWYQNDDGTYPANDWFWLDGDQNGVAESYRFDGNGWMFASSRVDGFDVNENGAWTVNGVVQTKIMEPAPAASREGTAVNQWISDSYGKQYYDSKGKLSTGWKKIASKQYYFDESGYMATGLVEIDGSQYYFYDNGIQAKDTVYAESEDVYYVMDKTDHCVVDIVDGDDWREYRQDADEDSVEIDDVRTEDNEKIESGAVNTDMTDEEAYEKIISLKKKYPEGKRWTNSNTFRRNFAYEYSYSIGGGCLGFAYIVQDKLYGPDASYEMYDSLDWGELRVGDHIRMYNNQGGEHSVIILTIGDDFVTVAVGNFNSSIHWGRKIRMDDLEEDFIYRETVSE